MLLLLIFLWSYHWRSTIEKNTDWNMTFPTIAPNNTSKDIIGTMKITSEDFKS